MAINSRERIVEDESDASFNSVTSLSNNDFNTCVGVASEDVHAMASKHISKKQKRSHSKTFKASSRTTALGGKVFESSLFQMQVEELLKTVTPKLKHVESQIASTLQSVKSIIEQIPDRAPMTISDAEQALLQERITIPFPEPRPNVNSSYMLHFARPERINVIGSYPLQTITQTNQSLSIDLMITMPRSIFQEKDYLNHRYFAKRTYYLACLAAGIKASDSCKFRLEFELLHGIHFLPVLTALVEFDDGTQRTKNAGNICIRVIPTLPHDVFLTRRLKPDKSCIRTKNEADFDENPHSTPFYNGTILHDCLATSYLKLQFVFLKDHKQYREACILGRVWLQQRSLDGTVQGGGFGNFEWAMCIGLLLQGGGPRDQALFCRGYSSYQLFKAMIRYLATQNLFDNPQVVGGIYSWQANEKSGAPIFFDVERQHNILFKMSAWSYQLLRHEAQVTLESFQRSNTGQFDSTFIMQVTDPHCRFDAFLQMPLLPLLNQISDRSSKSEKAIKSCQHVYEILKKSLTSRIKMIALQLPKSRKWSMEKSPKVLKPGQTLVVGLLFDALQVNRMVDLGPAAEATKDTAAYRQFWGDKAELRRYKDGRILESLVWNPDCSTQSVPEQIISYSLRRHFGAEIESQSLFMGSFPERLSGLLSIPSHNRVAQNHIQTFETLRQFLKNLEDLPLRIDDLLPANSQLSYSSSEAASPTTKHDSIDVGDSVITMESSTQWPDDIEAIHRTKIAFLIRIADSLEESDLGVKCKVGIENEDTPLENQCFVDVIFPDPMVIRLRIRHDREVALLGNGLKDKTLPHSRKLEYGIALSQYKRRFIHGPAHCQAIQALSIRHPFFSPSVRLVKQWFAEHLLSDHFADPLIELFTARGFTDPDPWCVPSSASSGFFRTLLFLSRWDWRHEPWIANLASEEMSGEQLSGLSTRFKAWRNVDPALNRVVIFVASNVDGDGTTWTDHASPPKVVAARLTQLSKAAISTMKIEGTGLNTADLFLSKTCEYDFVIHIKRQLMTTSQKKKTTQVFKNLEQKSIGLEEVGSDSYTCFVQELKELYSEAMVLFHDPLHRNIIAGLWNPMTDRLWKPKLSYSSRPDSESEKGSIERQCERIVVNRDAILNEISRLGGDLVESIQVGDQVMHQHTAV